MTIIQTIETAELKTSVGDYLGALHEYNKLVTLAKNDPLSYECRAFFKLEYLKDYKGAIEDYNTSIELYPNKEALINRAEAKTKLNDLKGAVSDFLKVLDLKPEKELRIKVLRKLADIATVNRNYKSAITCYNKVIDLDPLNLQVLLARASLMYNSNDNEGAIRDWEKVIELQPDNETASRNLRSVKDYLRSIEGFTAEMLSRAKPNL